MELLTLNEWKALDDNKELRTLESIKINAGWIKVECGDISLVYNTRRIARILTKVTSKKLGNYRISLSNVLNRVRKYCEGVEIFSQEIRFINSQTGVAEIGIVVDSPVGKLKYAVYTKGSNSPFIEFNKSKDLVSWLNKL